MYPNSFIKELENRISISDVVGKKLQLKKRGQDYVACCPFHNEKTPSFSVSDNKGIYHCFGCGKTGNIFTFVMETEGINFKEAIEYLANTFGIQLPKLEKTTNISKEEVNEIDILYKINEESCRFFENNFTKSTAKYAINYAIKRGLNKHYIKKFRIGYAENDFSLLFNHLKQLGYKEELIEKAGVIAKNDKGNYYDKFRNRLIFPVLDKKGRVIAFTGRILDDGMPKYMNSPETKIYSKGNILFNYYFARKSIYDSNSVILVEGNMDAISLSIYGIENVVAPMGTGITSNQIKELWRMTNNIFVCLDGDKAGQKASQRLSKLVLPSITIGKNIYFTFLPKDTDPDDFIRKYGKLEFKKLLENSISLSDFLWNNEMELLDINESKHIIPEKKAELEKNILQLLENINDIKLRSHFEQFYRNKLWKLGSVLHKLDNKNPIIKSEEIKDIKRKLDINLIEKNEKKVCAILLHYPNIASRLYKKYNIDIFAVNFITNKCSDILSILEENMTYNFNEEEFKKILVKNKLYDYINSSDFFIHSDVKEATEDKCLEIIYILLLEKEVMLMEFDLKEASEIGDIAKVKLINNELIKTKNKIAICLSNNNFI